MRRKGMKQVAIGSLVGIALSLTVRHGHAESGGQKIENGGHAVVCRNPSTHHVERAWLLDYYKSWKLKNRPIRLGSPELSVEEKVEIALKRLEAFSPSRAARYRERAQGFFEEIDRVRRMTLTPTEDSEHEVTEFGCQVEQLAIRRKQPLPDEKLFLVNADVFEALSNDDKAGLVLHEVIFEEALDYGQQSSKTSRYLNRAIAADLIGDLKSFDAIYEFTLAIQFAAMDYGGVLVTILGCDDGDWFDVTPQAVCPGATGRVPATKVPLNWEGSRLVDAVMAQVSDKGYLGSVPFRLSSKASTEKARLKASFHPSGRLRSLKLPWSTQLRVRLPGFLAETCFRHGGVIEDHLEFYDGPGFPIRTEIT